MRLRLLKNTHTHTPGPLAAPPGSHTPWRTDASTPGGKRGEPKVKVCLLEQKQRVYEGAHSFTGLKMLAFKVPPILYLTHIPPLLCAHSSSLLPAIVGQSGSPNRRGPAWPWQSSWTRSSVFLPRGTWSAGQLVAVGEQKTLKEAMLWSC